MTEMNRPDGRDLKQLRELSIEVGNLERADGSSKVRLGKNLAIASVFGPREQHPKFLALSDRANVRINYRMATFSVSDYKRNFPSRREKEISKVLSEAFSSVVITKHFPRSAIDVQVQLFESDGGTRTAAAIAVSAALADAGIPMRDIVAGIASGLYGDQVCLDLCGQEDMKGTGDMPILYAPELDEVSLFQLDGKFTYEQFKESFFTSIEAIKLISNSIKEALVAKYMKVKEGVAIVDDDEHDDEVKTAIQDTFISESEELSQSDEKEEDDEDEETPAFDPNLNSPFDPDDIPGEDEILAPKPVREESSPMNMEPETPTETTVSSTPTISNPEVSSNVSKPFDDEVWYEEKLGLKPMGRKETKGDNDVIRDIEYSLEEDDE